MRPKKIVLVWSENLASAEDLAYVLCVEGSYRAFAWDAMEDALALLTNKPVDGLICFTRASDGAGTIAAVGRLKQPHIPTLALTWGEKPVGDDPIWNGTMVASSPKIAILERVKMLTARKRGPRKGSTHAGARELCAQTVSA